MIATNQELFDRSAKHLLNQGRAARDFGGSCRYRTETGESCAIGALISDEFYNADMEQGTPLDTKVQVVLINAGLMAPYDQERILFLNNLQKAHDKASEASPEDFIRTVKFNLMNFAHNYGLNTAVLS